MSDYGERGSPSAKRGRKGRGAASGKGRGAQGRRRDSGRSRNRESDDDDDLDLELAFDSQPSFSLEVKLSSEKFTSCFVQEMLGKDFTVAHVQKNGFATPILFREKSGLDIKVPKPDFTVADVRQCVGSRRMVDVMDVATQRNLEMNMKDWQQYYENPDKDRLLNVISLEFSHTKLEHMVQPPRTVRLIDWVETMWPRSLKMLQKDSTNSMDDMWYPKVQKYCLMSVGGCYTDFHIDFGGTSVWYHVLKGSKIFWLIPPTERNLQLYEQWTLSGKQSDIFFGDLVEKCSRIKLDAGNTFLIPSGWIHAVYTPSDSLVFGGNFLHSFAIENQLRIAQLEDVTRVPPKFRFPFYTEMLWYVLERYVHTLLRKSHLDLSSLSQVEETVEDSVPNDRHVHLTSCELHGLRAIVLYLHSLPPTRKNVPDVLTNPVALIQDVRTLMEQHRKDQNHLSVTGVPVVTLAPLAQKMKRPATSISSINAPSVLRIKTESPPTPQPCASTAAHPVAAQPEVVIKKEEPDSPVSPEEEEAEAKPIVKTQSPFFHLQNQLRMQQQDAAKKLRQPVCVVRPATIGPIDPRLQRQKASGVLLGQLSDQLQLVLRPEVLVPVFSYLSVADLLVCMRVCRSWNRYTIDPSLWRLMDLSHRQLTPIILAGIIRRQPRCLVMDWSSLSHQQCSWLLDRLPHLAALSMQGCSTAVLAALKLPTTVSPVAFNRPSFPKLTLLDLSWVSGLNDVLLEKSILSSPSNRLTNLKYLGLAGAELTDQSLTSIATCFPALEHICLAHCVHTTAQGLYAMVSSNGNIQRVDLMGCKQLVDYPALVQKMRIVRPNLKITENITNSETQPIHRCFRFK